MPKRERETNEQQAEGEAGADHDSSFVTLLVMKGTSVQVDPSKYGFLSTQVQDEAYAQQYVNTDEVIADLSEGAMGPELAADIATTLDVADGKITVTDVRLAAQTLRGADYLQLREELYLEQAVTVLKSVKDSESPPAATPAEVVPCVHTGQLMWDRLGAYNVLRLEQMGIISLGHKGVIDAKDKRISDELLALATTLNDVTSLDISYNDTINTCEPFAETLVELNASWCGRLTDNGLRLCTKIRKLNLTGTPRVTSCAPFADALQELQAGDDCGITDDSLRCCRKIRKLSIDGNPHVTTCAPFAVTLEALEAFGDRCGMTDDGLKDCTKLRKLDAAWNDKITTCEPFLDTLEYLVSSPGFTTASLNQIAENCRRLRHIDLHDTSGIVNDEMIHKIASNCRELEYLLLSGCAAVTDAAIIAVAENCTHLQNLLVDEIAITDASIIRVAENCPQLTLLSLCNSYRNNKITDAAITAIAKNCNKLQVLIICDQRNITDVSILEIAKCCPLLRELDLEMVVRGNITNESLKHLPSSCCVKKI